MQLFGNSQEPKIISYPVRDDLIKFNMIFYCCMAHPTIMFRNTTIGPTLEYEKTDRIEDYALWIGLMQKNMFKFGNIGSVLLKHRKHPKSLSTTDTLNDEIPLKQ